MLHLLLLLACTDGPGAAAPSPKAETGTPGAETGDSGATTSPVVGALQFDGPAPRNVLMVSIDTFRRDHLDPYSDLALTPFLGKLANEGVRLDDHIQCSNWTWHSTSCTLAGRYELDVGHAPVLVGQREPLPDGIRTLARVLSEDHQYGSVLQSKNAWLGPQWNNAQGYTIVNPSSNPGAFNLVANAMSHRDAAMLQTGGDHWFVHVHLLEPHAPYVAPEEYRVGVDELPPLPEGIDLDKQDAHYTAVDMLDDLSEEDADTVLQHMHLRYQAEIRWVDAQLEAAFADLDAQGALDDTLVVVWTDHGEAFLEHGVQSHAHNLYAEENDAVLFFWAKNIQPFVYTEPTHAVDLLPTVLSILDLPLDDDLSGYPLGTAPSGRVRFASAVARQGLQISALQDGYKLLYRNPEVRWTLFDTTADPEEKLDLLVARPDHPVYQELQPLVVERIEAFQELATRSPGGVSP